MEGEERVNGRGVVAQVEGIIGGGERSRLERDQPGIILEVSVGWVQIRSLSGSWRLCRKGEMGKYALTSLYARYSPGVCKHVWADRWMAIG